MNLFNTTQRSWKLLQSSIFVIRKHPKLFLFPFLIGGFTIVVAAFFMSPLIVTTVKHPPFAPGYSTLITAHGIAMPRLPSWVYGYCLLLYPLSMFCATFCNVAFYSQILAALNGDKVSIRRGFQIAVGRIKTILVWSLFAGLVGALIREIESRLGFVGRIVTGLIGLSWSVACVFVIPVMIREPSTGNAVKILSKSAGTIKRTWGESVFGYVGIGSLNLLVAVCAVVVAAVTFALAVALRNFWILLPVGALLFLGCVAYSCIASVARQVYLCAIYVFASEGIIPEPYNQELLDQAWKVKNV